MRETFRVNTPKVTLRRALLANDRTADFLAQHLQMG